MGSAASELRCRCAWLHHGSVPWTLGVETVGLGAPVFTRYRYARCVDDMGLDAARPEPARQPETISAGLEGNCDAFDLASCFLRFLSPSMHSARNCRVSSATSVHYTGRRTTLLKRAFLGWLRGERDHCKMVAIPTIEDEDAKRPNREREGLVGEQTRIINRMKGALSRLGIRGFNPKMKKAAQRTPEDEPIPPNTLAELRRDMERRRLISEQIRQIENARLERIEHAPRHGPHAMVRVLARVIGVGIETADMLVQEALSRNMRDRRAVARYAGLTGSPDESGTRRRGAASMAGTSRRFMRLRCRPTWQA